MTPRANVPQPKLHLKFNNNKQTFLFTSKPPNPPGKGLIPPLHLLENTKLHYMDPDDPPIPRLPSPSLPSTASTAQDSVQVLANEVHASHLSRQSEYVSGKSTDKKYQNRVREYLEWWENDQALRCEVASRNGTLWIPVPAQPITATKVALYLDYATTRPQVNQFSLLSIIPSLNIPPRKILMEKIFQILE